MNDGTSRCDRLCFIRESLTMRTVKLPLPNPFGKTSWEIPTARQFAKSRVDLVLLNSSQFNWLVDRTAQQGSQNKLSLPEVRLVWEVEEL